MKDLTCPYCGHEQDVCHDDGQGYEEDVLHEEECYECEKYFTFHTTIIFHYKEFKADCLNDDNHKFKPTRTFPKECTQMKCQTCEEKREPTDEEWVEINKN